MRFLSVCSGIEAASVAWKPFGWKAHAFSEIEPFPSAVLARHYPDTPNLGDMTKWKDWPDADVSLLVGGTPCQSFSVAGLRKGMDDPRGNLALVYLAIADRYRPRWVVWENVPGVLSSNKGRDFGAFLGGLAELGYGFAYRVLDAQYVRTFGLPFAVPQRRRRVFVVGYLGDWRRAAAVLFDSQSLRGDPPPCRQAGERVAPTLAARTRGGGGLGTDFDCDGGLVTSTGAVSHCLNAGGMGRIDYETETMIAHSLRGEGFDASEDGTGRGTPLVPVQPFTLMERGRDGSPNLEYRQDGTANAILTPNGGRGGLGVGAVAFDEVQITSKANRSTLKTVCPTMTKESRLHAVTPWVVRRLMPLECERLQGFPDGYTDVPYRNGRSADGPRYKALGNSMAVNVMQWIGERIQLVEDITKERAA